MKEKHVQAPETINPELRDWFYNARAEAYALDYHLEETRRNLGKKGLPTNLPYNPYEAITHLATVCDILATSPHLVGSDSLANETVEELLAKARSSLPNLGTD